MKQVIIRSEDSITPSYMMRKKKYSSPIVTYQLSDLELDVQKLIAKAKAQTKLSYAPYSNFHVGAALVMENNKYILGCNQENASYPLCICAERVALYTYGAKKRKFKIAAMAVTAENMNQPLLEPCMPCGACRQVLLEYEQKQNSPIAIYATANGIDSVIYAKSILDILPSAFDKRALK